MYLRDLVASVILDNSIWRWRIKKASVTRFGWVVVSAIDLKPAGDKWHCPRKLWRNLCKQFFTIKMWAINWQSFLTAFFSLPRHMLSFSSIYIQRSFEHSGSDKTLLQYILTVLFYFFRPSRRPMPAGCGLSTTKEKPTTKSAWELTAIRD